MTKNIKIKRLSKKLDHKMIGPYKVKQLVRLSCQLNLPISIKIHNIFHSNLLQKTSTNPFFGQHNYPAPLVIVDNKEKWKVYDILDARRKRKKKIGKKIVGGKIQYCVK